MNLPGKSTPVSRSERIYAALSCLNPTTFRNRFGESMRFAFAAQAREPQPSLPTWGETIELEQPP